MSEKPANGPQQEFANLKAQIAVMRDELVELRKVVASFGPKIPPDTSSTLIEIRNTIKHLSARVDGWTEELDRLRREFGEETSVVSLTGRMGYAAARAGNRAEQEMGDIARMLSTEANRYTVRIASRRGTALAVLAGCLLGPLILFGAWKAVTAVMPERARVAYAATVLGDRPKNAAFRIIASEDNIPLVSLYSGYLAISNNEDAVLSCEKAAMAAGGPVDCPVPVKIYPANFTLPD